MSTKNKILLKVCGMGDDENVRQITACHPDYMGFIFFKGSKRFVGENFRIPIDFPRDIKRVGVFVNADLAEIRRLVAVHALDFVQLHGMETAEICAELKSERIGVIKVFSVDEQFDLKNLGHYEKAVDYFLFDTKGKEAGGNGQAFDWSLLESYNQRIPFLLSGGLSESNVHEIKKLRQMNLHALDVNSRVEKEPGIKDVELVKRFQTEMKKLWATL